MDRRLEFVEYCDPCPQCGCTIFVMGFQTFPMCHRFVCAGCAEYSATTLLQLGKPKPVSPPLPPANPGGWYDEFGTWHPYA